MSIIFRQKIETIVEKQRDSLDISCQISKFVRDSNNLEEKMEEEIAYIEGVASLEGRNNESENFDLSSGCQH